ncbi:MAG: hypothetical protein RIR01_2277 [Bacteroidota bacterium]|jgi:hypothetical protein
MKAIVVPFNASHEMDLSRTGKVVSLTITEKGSNGEQIIPRSQVLLQYQSENLNIVGAPRYIDIPSNWKNKKGLNIKVVKQNQIKRFIVADYEPFIHSKNLSHVELLTLQLWASNTFDIWNISNGEPCVLLFDASDKIIRNNPALSELLHSEEIAMGAVNAIMSNIDEIPVSEYNLLLFETRAMIDAEKYKKLKSFIGTDNESMLLKIIDSCNMAISITEVLLLFNEIHLTDKHKTLINKLPRLKKIMGKFINNAYFKIDEIVDYSEMIKGRTLGNDEKLFIAENFKTNVIKSNTFDVKFKLKQRLNK